MGLKDMQAAALGSGTMIDAVDFTSSASAASDSIASIDSAINVVSSFRADLGAAQNQLEHTIANVNVAIEDPTASESRNRAQEFTSLIVAERGFQASSRVISASDEMLSDLVNLKR